jgi:hypothetical protein
MSEIVFTRDDYTNIRRRGLTLNSKIFKQLTTNDIKTCAKQLGVWHNKQLCIAEEAMDLFMDYATFAYRPKGFNMAERYLRLFSKQADDFERALLTIMSRGYFAIYQIESTDGVNSLVATDVFSKTRYHIADYQLAETAFTGLMLAGYLIDFADFSVQTGGTVYLTREIMTTDEVVRIIDSIEDNRVSEFLRDPDNGAKLARAIISATIRLGQAKNFRHKLV